MHPIDFEGTNVDITKPDSMTAEECSNLKGKRYVNHFGIVSYVTGWRLDEVDIALIKIGKPLVIELLFGELMYVHVSPWIEDCPSSFGVTRVFAYLPGKEHLYWIEKYKRVFITFITSTFPVMRVQVLQ